jgi:tRNA-uridine 2-sulfurtransferase
MGKRVVVGLSGGVDSSVAAHLLLEQGYEVIGVFMRNWHDESVTINNECPWVDDSNDAMMVAEHLGIPFYVLDLSEQYRQRIVDYMFSEYERGRTPNPDVLCNREIKFDLFLHSALELKADFVATGHYCRNESIEVNGHTIYRLLAGADPGKDQSYFLCQLNQKQLSKAMFPIGHLMKSQVRELARKAELPTAEKKDSQGLCFIGKVKLPVFLQQQLKIKEGRVIEVPGEHPMFRRKEDTDEQRCDAYAYAPEDGKDIGAHQGAHFYTIGQRKGLNIGGHKDPLFVIGIDTFSNTVFVGEGENHPGLNRLGLRIPLADISWVREDLIMTTGEERTYSLKIRYRQPLTPARLKLNSDELLVLFEEKQKGIAPGQFAAWYDGEELLGSGVIS